MASFAQNWGINTRTGISSYRSDFDATDHAFAYGVGVFRQVPLTRSLSFQPQIWYLNMLAKNSFNEVSSNSPVTFRSRSHYLAADLGIRLDIGKSPIHPFITIGPRINTYLFTNYNITGALSGMDYDKIQRSTVIKNVNFSGFVTVGLQAKRWSVGVEYNRDILPFIKNANQAGFKTYGRSLMFNVGYRF